jgi:tetratricopeptide (TPR) repeat protein
MPIDSLATLETTGLIRLAQIQPELEYLFRHALVQEAAYDSILKADRKNLHLAVAHELERLYPERLDDLAALLAAHYREAGEKQKAFEYYVRAAQHALKKFANREAEYNLQTALEFCPNENERAATLLSLGVAQIPLGKMEEAEASLRSAMPFFRTQKDFDKIAQIYGQLAVLEWGRNDMGAALSVSLEGIKEVGDLPPSENYAELLRNLVSAYLFNGMLDEAEVAVAKALECAKKANAKGALAHILVNQGLIDGHRGRPLESIANYENAIAVAEETHNYYALARARNNLATVLISLGRNLEASEQMAYMVELSHRLHWVINEIWFPAQLNGMYLDQGRIAEAETLLPDIQNAVEASGGKSYIAQARGAWLQTELYKGNLAYAMPGLVNEKQEAAERNDKQHVIAFAFFLAIGYWLEGDIANAVSELQFGIEQAGVWAGSNYKYLLASLQVRAEADTTKARATFDSADKAAYSNAEAKPTYEQETNRHYALMHIYAREGNFSEALSHAAIAAQMYHDAHLRWLYAHVLREWGDIALAAKDLDRARELYGRSIMEFEEMSLPVFAGKIRKQLNQVG